MSNPKHVTIRCRHVAGRLRDIREGTGMTLNDAADLLGVSISKISRMETGCATLFVDEVATLLGLYKVEAAERERLLDLVRKSQEKNWWERLQGVPEPWASLMDFETRTSRIQTFQPLVVPGLLQTAEYSREVITQMDPTLSETEVEARVGARMARQWLLTKPFGPSYVAVLDESVLRRPVGDRQVMVQQLRHLLDMSDRPNVLLRVVPQSAGAHAGLRGSFVLMEFQEAPPLVYLEAQGTHLYLEEPEDVGSYKLALSNILSMALAPDATRELIVTLLDEAG
ncbi:helix-turn-helix domain-containing protein [Amycolatopsis arida]|nr:helix-turn-helix transcriptional regulator [Amycolatopsis arida]